MLAIVLMRVCLSMAQLASPSTGTQSGVPEILKKAMMHRSNFRTAELSMRRVFENRDLGRRVNNYEIRIAGPSEYWVDNGDDDGLHGTMMKTGDPRLGVRNVSLPREHVWDLATGVHWRHCFSDEHFELNAIKPNESHFDVRTIGLQEVEINGDTLQKAIDRLVDRPDAKYVVGPMEYDLVRVYCVAPAKHSAGTYVESEWLIDFSKGPSVIAKTSWLCRPGSPRNLLSEVRVQLVEVDGRWWPRKSEINSPAGGTKITHELTRIEFDRPDHPQRIDADYMNIPVGARVFNVLEGTPKKERYISNGQSVSDLEWKQVRQSYDPAPLARFRQKMRSMGDGTFPRWWEQTSADLGVDGVSHRPDQWEVYVRRWVMRHTTNHSWKVIEPLTDAQKAAAQSVLTDCRDKANPIRSRCDDQANSLRAELVRLEKLYAVNASRQSVRGGAATQPVQFESADVYRKADALRARISELEKPKEIASLFEELKTRLSGILTTKQRDPRNGFSQQPVLKAVRFPNGRDQVVHPK